MGKGLGIVGDGAADAPSPVGTEPMLSPAATARVPLAVTAAAVGAGPRKAYSVTAGPISPAAPPALTIMACGTPQTRPPNSVTTSSSSSAPTVSSPGASTVYVRARKRYRSEVRKRRTAVPSGAWNST